VWHFVVIKIKILSQFNLAQTCKKKYLVLDLNSGQKNAGFKGQLPYGS